MSSSRSRRSEFSARVTIYEPTVEKQEVQEDNDVKSVTTPTRFSPRFNKVEQVKKEETTEENDLDLIPSTSTPSKRSRTTTPKSASPRKKPVFKIALEKAHPTPPRWKEAYDIIKLQRSGIVAAVDTMGCEQGGLTTGAVDINEKDSRLAILVSLMLSSQTKDPVTHQATMNLRTQLKGGLTLKSFLEATVEEINDCIAKVGFHNTKATNLKKLAVRLTEEHGGDVPDDLPSLLDLNGVGPKMSILYLQAIGQNVGIGVDVHVARISNRLGWHKPGTEEPEKVRLNLESWLPKEYHREINKMLVGFGQTICKPVGPRCDLCDVAKVARLCPSKRVVSPKKSSPKKAKKEEEEDVDADVKGKGRAVSPKLEIEIEPEIKVEVKMELQEEEDGVDGAKNSLIW